MLQENEMLEERIKLLHKELVFLKDIFFAHAGSKHGLSDIDMDIKTLLEENDEKEIWFLYPCLLILLSTFNKYVCTVIISS